MFEGGTGPRGGLQLAVGAELFDQDVPLGALVAAGVPRGHHGHVALGAEGVLDALAQGGKRQLPPAVGSVADAMKHL
eukprot:13176168-Heterocapsa_arctica.AAC.1